MRRRKAVVDLPALATLDRTRGQLGRQLARLLRSAVHAGDLQPGEWLPSSRLLAQSLGIARSTVIEAFEQLSSEGVLESHAGAGTRVSRALRPAEAPAPSVGDRATSPASQDLPAPAIAFAALADEFRPLPQAPFAIGVPMGEAQPDEAWRKLGNRIRARGTGGPTGYADPAGVIGLREAIAHYVRRTRSVHCSPDQIVITTGIQQALYVCCQILLDTGQTAWVEDPAYRGITAILESMRARVGMARVPVDDEGIDVAAGMAAAPHAKAAFVTPSHQYPLGMPMSLARRTALLDWARTHDAWVVEDDYDSELRYAGHPFPALQGMDPERVLYLGTFSKIMFPSLRLGYAILPARIAPAFRGARIVMDRHAPTADQHVLATFIAEGHLDRHVKRIRNVYATRRVQLMEIVAAALPPERGWLQPSDQGMHTILWLDARTDDCSIARLALEAGISVRATSPLFSEGRRRPGLILGLGDFGYDRMRVAFERLAAIILSQPTSPRS